jgi:virulence-associated protein VapD
MVGKIKQKQSYKITDKEQETTTLIKGVFSNEYLNKAYDFLSQMKRSGIGNYPITENEFRNLTNMDISYIYQTLNAIYTPSEVIILSGFSSPDNKHLERVFLRGNSFEQAYKDIKYVIENHQLKSKREKVFLKENIAEEIIKKYPKINIIDDIETGKRKLVGVENIDIILGSRNEQSYIIIQNALEYDGKKQYITEIIKWLTDTRKSKKVFLGKTVTSSEKMKARKHLISIISEVNRTIKEKNGVSKIVSYSTKNLATDEIIIYFMSNVNLGKTSG